MALTIELPSSSWASSVDVSPDFPALTPVSPPSVGTLWGQPWGQPRCSRSLNDCPAVVAEDHLAAGYPGIERGQLPCVRAVERDRKELDRGTSGASS